MRVALLSLFTLVGCQASAPRQGEGAGGFPASFVGDWGGELRIFSNRPQTVPMELHVRPLGKPGRFTWTLVYGAGAERQERAYELRVVDAGRGEFEIDERNSIVLSAQWRGGVLVSEYAVGEVKMRTTWRRVSDVLLFELIAGPRSAARTTGGDGAPRVEVFETRTRQEAVLRRR